MLNGACKAGSQSSTRFQRKWIPTFVRMTKVNTIILNPDWKSTSFNTKYGYELLVYLNISLAFIY